MDKDYVCCFKMSNVSSGHFTHHQGCMKFLCWKRVLRFVFKEKDMKIILEERNENNIRVSN